MSVFIDASAIVAILGREPDGPAIAARAAAIEGDVYMSGMVLFEAVMALARKEAEAGRRPTVEMIAKSRRAVGVFASTLKAKMVEIDSDVTDRAIVAATDFGKVVGHPAALNFGDCFAYACARSRNASLLYKGDDFSKTDITST